MIITINQTINTSKLTGSKRRVALPFRIRVVPPPGRSSGITGVGVSTPSISAIAISTKYTDNFTGSAASRERESAAKRVRKRFIASMNNPATYKGTDMRSKAIIWNTYRAK